MRGVWGLRAAGLAVFLVAWELIARSGLVAGSVLPSVDEVVMAVPDVTGQRDFSRDLFASLYEIVIGTGIGALVALPLGAVMGSTDYLYRLVDPLLYYFGAVPKIVLLPLLVLFVGTGIESKVGIAAVSAAFPIAVSTALAFRELRPIFVSAARTLGASRRQQYQYVYIPSLLGPLLSGVRLGLGVAITAALLGETKVADVGLGFRAIEYYSRLEIAEMYALLMLVFAGASAINLGLSALIRRVTHYQRQAVTAGGVA